MFCPKCGAQIDDNVVTCPACGAAIQNQQTTQIPNIVINNVNTNTNTNTNTVGAGVDYPYKSKWVAFFLCLFLGYLGIHRFYVGKIGTGVIWFFTLGFFGFGALIDLIMILAGAFRDKVGYALK